MQDEPAAEVIGVVYGGERRKEPLPVYQPGAPKPGTVHHRSVAAAGADRVREVDPAVPGVVGMRHHVEHPAIGLGEHRRQPLERRAGAGRDVEQAHPPGLTLGNERASVREKRDRPGDLEAVGDHLDPHAAALGIEDAELTGKRCRRLRRCRHRERYERQEHAPKMRRPVRPARATSTAIAGATRLRAGSRAHIPINRVTGEAPLVVHADVQRRGHPAATRTAAARSKLAGADVAPAHRRAPPPHLGRGAGGRHPAPLDPHAGARPRAVAQHGGDGVRTAPGGPMAGGSARRRHVRGPPAAQSGSRAPVPAGNAPGLSAPG